MLTNELFGQILDFIFFILPIIIPVLLLILLFNLWVDYARSKFISEQENVLLKIIPPRDVFKTPAAMELVIEAFYQTAGESDFRKKYWKGGVRAWFSLEMVSNGGIVNFYIWTRKAFVRYIQSQLHAQYPGIEVSESEDYSEKIDYLSGDYKLWGLEYELTDADPIPIKTYIDYNLDKVAKEEEKVDPITSTLEYLASLKPGESAWLQILIRAHKKEDKDPNKWFGKTDNWKNNANKEIKKIREDSFFEFEGADNIQKMPMATKGQNEKIAAIERSISKTPFDVGMRGIYLAEKDIFDPVNIGAIVSSFKHYSSSSLNGFKPGIKTSVTDWKDPFGYELKRIEHEILDAYRERGYFWRDFRKNWWSFCKEKRKVFILNSEELATIFHLPGTVSQTPSVERVQSKRQDPPAELPI